MMKKYTGKYDPCEHLTQWTKVWGENPQREWVHIFCHTLDTISMNWYLEMELRHGTTKWDILKEILLLTLLEITLRGGVNQYYQINNLILKIDLYTLL